MSEKILILTPSLSGGGAEKVAINLANEWGRQGHDTYLTSIKDISDYSHLVSDDVAFSCLGAGRLRGSIFALIRHIQHIQPARILSVIRDTNIILGLTRPDLKKISVIYREANTLHDLDRRSELYRRLYLASMRHFYRRVNAVVANSNDTLYDLQARGVHNANVKVIPNPVLPINYDSLMQEDADHRWLADKSVDVILSVGRLHPQKDYPTLIRAFALVVQKKPAARLLILGKGPDEKALKNLRSELRLDKVVSFYGFVRNPWPFYRRARIFALSSQWEGFGNVVVEALATGTTVVTTDCAGGPRSIIKDGEFGYLTHCGDPEHLACNLIRALDFPQNPSVLRERARDFSASGIAECYMAMFDR